VLKSEHVGWSYAKNHVIILNPNVFHACNALCYAFRPNEPTVQSGMLNEPFCAVQNAKWNQNVKSDVQERGEGPGLTFA